MQKLYFTLLALTLAVAARAQLPQHTAGAAAAGNYFPLGSTDGKGGRVQLLYKPSDFGALPATGIITRLYFKAHNSTESEGLASYSHFSLRMAATTMDELPADGSSLLLPMNTVFEAAQYQAHFSRGQWLVFSLQQPFVYRDTSNFIVELSVAEASAMRYLGFVNTTGTRRVWGRAGSHTADGSDAKLYAIGVDVSPVVAGIAAMPVPIYAAGEEPTPALEDEAAAEVAVAEAPLLTTQQPEQPEHSNVHAAATTDMPVRRNGNKWFITGTWLLAALGVGVLLPLLPRSRRLAAWAVHHPGRARRVLFAMQFLASIAALYTGIKIYDYGFTSSVDATNALLVTSTVATLLYPRSNARGNQWKAYARQKLTGAFVVASGFGLLTSVGNRCASDQNFCRPATYVIMKMDSDHYERATPYRAYDSGGAMRNRGWKVLATIGAVVLLIALLCVTTVLACAVFCVIALDSSSIGVIIAGILAGGLVGAAGGWGSVSLFIYLRDLIWRGRRT